MSKKKNKQPKIAPMTPRQQVVNAYLAIMFCIFPVFCTDGFFNIRHDRYWFFLAVSAALLLFWGITILAGDREGSIGKMTVTDWAMLGFLAVCILSTVFSIDPDAAFWGTAGRNNGLLLMIAYVGTYFVVSRNGRPHGPIFAALGITSAFVSLVAVLNFFAIDPLKMVRVLSASDQKIFFSTIGNKNLLSGYLCITMPVLMVLFVESRQSWLRKLAFICLIPGFPALMAADSDSGLLGLGLFAALYLVRYICHPGKLKRFLLIWTVMLLSTRLLLLPLLLSPDVETKSISQLQLLFVSNPKSLLLLLMLAVVTALLYLLDHKKPNLRLPSMVYWGTAAVLGAGLLSVIGAMIYFTKKPQIPLDGLGAYLRLNESWGTNRGFMWMKTLDIFRDFNLWRKLFGAGPDTYYYLFQPYFGELAQLTDRWVTSTNTAHNEYLHYLVTIGFLGTAAYITALISAVIYGLKSLSKNPTGAIYLAAMICYGTQALVSIAQPITTPLMIIFLALTVSSTKNDPHP